MLRETGTRPLCYVTRRQRFSYNVLAVQRFANDVVAPKVREMDENEMMDPSIIQGLFSQGVSSATRLFCLDTNSSSQLMGIETSAEHGGAGSSFTSAIIAIEELAKVDPSVSVMCDVHNTLVNTVIRTYGTKEQQDKWLPQLAESKVNIWFKCVTIQCSSIPVGFFLPFRACFWIRRLCTANASKEG